MSKIANIRGRRGRIVAILLVAVLGATAAAWAYWSQPSKGSASGHVGSLGAPTISGATGGAEAATINWSSVTAPGSGTVKYYVSRDGAAAGGNCPTSASPSTATSCTDASVAPGSHSYTVTAVWRSWTATSASKSATAVSAPVVSAANASSRGQGSGATTITLTGSHFASGASTTISGTGVTVNSTTFKSSTELTVAITVAAGAPVGARNVTVTNTDSGSGTGTGIFTINAAPTVTSASPSSRGQGASNQLVAIKGTGFAAGAKAAFSGTGITVASTTVKSATELTAEVSVSSSAATGLRSVTVTNSDEGAGSLANAFNVNAAPVVTSTSPSSRGQGASTTIAIKGSNFVNGASANFSGSGVTVESTSFSSSTELKAKVSIESGAAVGLRAVTVTNPDEGVGTLANAFTVNAAPIVTSASPSSRPQGASGQSITIKGSGFVSGTGLAVSFSGSGITVNSTTFKNSTELTANITVASSATVAARTIIVKNPDEGVGSLVGGFTVNAAPNIESVSPNAGDKGGTQTVTIKGTGFAIGASASFSSGVNVEGPTTFVSSTELKAKISVETFISSGSRSLTVAKTDGGSDTLEGAFTVSSGPSIESVSPSSRGQGSSNQTITVKGKNFFSGTGLAVSFSGTGITVNSTNFVSSTAVTANVTIASNASASSRSVTVTNPDTTSATANSAFSVTSAPTVTSASPNARGQGASNATVTIKGSGFASGVSSSFGPGITVESTTRNSSTELTATISIDNNAAPGLRAVAVTNPDEGTGSLANAFTVNAAPTVASVSPSSRGQGASGQTITIKGSGFVSGAAVGFSGSGITASTTFKSSTELTANINVAASAGAEARTVTVTNPDEGEGSLANAFTVNAGPNVESVTPTAGDRGGAQAVAIKGSGFVSGASVTFGSGVNLASVSVKSSTEITATATVESGASTGSRTITVTNPDEGTDFLTGGFTVNAAPSIESVSPSSRGQGASNQTIAIKGKNFLSGTGLAASFSGTGITVNSTSFVSATEVTANITVAAGATTGLRNVTVTNPDATTATSTNAFTVNAPPTLTSTSPSSRGQGASSQTVAIKGSGFVSGTLLAATFSGAGVNVNSTTFKSSTELTANVTVESGASIGLRSLTVTNGDGSTATLANAFTVNAAAKVESLSPSARAQGAGSTTIAVKGSGFVSGTGLELLFSGTGISVESTSFVSATELSAKVAVESGASTGLRTVTVTNGDGGTSSLANGFTVDAKPTITSLIPSRPKVSHGSPGEFEIVGTGFVAGTTVTISGGFSVTNTAVSGSTKIKVKVTAGGANEKGTYSITVTNPDGGAATSFNSIENT
ncbi:MAG: beta strand repeat-containing protein [Solirubrobacteraceae bacterium]